MPGVNLDFLPASQPTETLGTPDSTSGLEEVIGDLLAQKDVENEDEDEFNEKKFDLTLQCAVRDIHSDLQVFGKEVDARLEEAAAQVAPLFEAISRLQEENLKLRNEQARMVRQVEALFQVMGLPDPKLEELGSKESSSVVNEPKSLCNDASTIVHEETTSEASHDSSACSLQDAPCTLQEPATSSILRHRTNIPGDKIPILQASALSSEKSSPQMSESSLISHPPNFATHRSLSAPSLTTNSSSNSSTVAPLCKSFSPWPILNQINHLNNGNVFCPSGSAGLVFYVLHQWYSLCSNCVPVYSQWPLIVFI